MSYRYDYIIVGAGSAGCVLAGRLSADPGKEVLLLECGGDRRDFLIGVPKGIGKLVRSPAHYLTYESGWKLLAGLSPEVWIRGKGLGGSSAINGMIWYKALEGHQLGPSDTHGSSGPVTISSGTFRYPLTDDMIAAGEMMGPECVGDLNDKPVERVGCYSHNIGNVCCSTATRRALRGRWTAAGQGRQRAQGRRLFGDAGAGLGKYPRTGHGDRVSRRRPGHR